MPVSIVPCGKDDIEVVRALISHPSLQGEYAMLVHPGVLEDSWGDPYADFELRWLALVDGAPAGYLFTLILPSTTGAWAMIRPAVIAPHRRRGIGTTLLRHCLARLEEQKEARRLNEYCLSAWMPSESATGFATHHGFRPVRTFWRMERRGTPTRLRRVPERGSGSPPAVAWPPGIEVRAFDGGEQALHDWDQVYNASFAGHYHYVVSNLDHTREITTRRTFRPDGLLLAYRGGRCVGFCRNVIRGREGEIGMLGVVPEARGIGLGRALLRWGAQWLERMDCAPIELMVDGENETALGLYRSEGFEVVRTRAFWSRI